MSTNRTTHESYISGRNTNSKGSTIQTSRDAAGPPETRSKSHLCRLPCLPQRSRSPPTGHESRSDERRRDPEERRRRRKEEKGVTRTADSPARKEGGDGFTETSRASRRGGGGGISAALTDRLRKERSQRVGPPD